MGFPVLLNSLLQLVDIDRGRFLLGHPDKLIFVGVCLDVSGVGNEDASIHHSMGLSLAHNLIKGILKNSAVLESGIVSSD